MRCRTNFWAIAILLALLLALAEFAVAQGTTIPAPGSQPSGLAFDGTFLFVSTASGFRTIFKLDPATGAVLDSFLAPSPTGFDGRGNPSDMVSDGASRLFVSDIGNFGAGIVREIDSAGTTTFNSFSLPFRGGAIAFDGTKLFNADFDSSEILVTDRSGTPIRTFVTGLRPAGMVFDPATGHLWVISQFNKTISEITTQGDLIRQCDGPRNPGIQGLGAVTLVGSKLYIAEVSDPDPFTPPDIPGTIFIVDPRSLTCDPPLVLTVTIDIKPGSDRNAINTAGAGLTPVAILTTDTFDATTVSPITVQFGPAGANLEHQLGHLEDVDGDGDLDLVLHFRIQDTGIQCGDTEASLTGETFDGQSIQGLDSIVTVGCSVDSIQVDQFQLDGSEQNQAISGNFLGSRGQSFTVGKSGLLHAIELSLFEIGSGGDLTVTILDLSGGDLSTAPILGSVAVPESAIGRAPTMLTLARVTATLIDLSSLNLNVNEGDVLAFRLSSVRELPNLYAVRTAIFSDLYAGGAFFARNVFLAVGDMAFKTFIAVPEPDQADIVATSNQGNLVGIDLDAGTARLIGVM